jgi:hypothetical protein
MIRFWILAFALLVSSFSSSATGADLDIKVVRLQRADAGRHLKWTLSITNNTAAAVRLSNFSLNIMLRRIDLQDTDGKSWEVKPETNIIDPPPTVVDYSFVIQSGSNAVASFKTLGIMLGEAGAVGTNNSPELVYRIHHEVSGIIGNRSAEYSAAGSGKVQVEEQAGR